MNIAWNNTIPQIIELVKIEKPQSVLDIGACIGKTGLFIREELEYTEQRYKKEQWQIKVDGAELLAECKNEVHNCLYNNIYDGVLTDTIKKLTKYDVILLDNVLQYFSKVEGLNIIDQLMKHTAKKLIVTVPAQQCGGERCPFIKHEYSKRQWSAIDFSQYDFYYQTLSCDTGKMNVFTFYPYKPEQSFTDNFTADITASGTEPLTIGYVLPHKNLTGGMKMLLQQMQKMRIRGHRINALLSGKPGDSALPEWWDAPVDKEIIVPIDQPYREYIQGCDVVVAGWFMQLPELANDHIPILYWEQGHELLFGDLSGGGLKDVYEIRRYLQYCYLQPCEISAVSPLVANLLEARFRRKVPVINNGVNTDLYFPGNPSGDNTILLLGNPGLPFKGFDIALKVLESVWKDGYSFKVKWVCQNPPKVNNLKFPIQYIVKPQQKELVTHYQQADLCLFTSWYEGFGMPPLEAMACGLPVVATLCGGIETYAQHGYNAFLAETGDVDSLAKGIELLLDRADIRKKLSERGRQTALEYNLSNTVCEMEKYLRYLVESKNK